MGEAPEGEIERHYTVGEVSELFSVKSETVRDWIISGKLKGVKLPGGQWRVTRSNLAEFANKNYGD